MIFGFKAVDLGLQFIEAIPEKDILMNEDINDENNDGISGKAVRTKDENGLDRLGRFGVNPFMRVTN